MSVDPNNFGIWTFTFPVGTGSGSNIPVPITSPLLHAPADILRWLLVSLTLGTDPALGSTWPVYHDSEPNTPDSVITCYDTSARVDGRGQISGDVWKHDGFQIRVRSLDAPHGFAKIEAIRIQLNEGVRATSVTVSTPADLGTATYTVFSINKLSAVIRLGKEKPVGKRSIFTLNGMMSVYRTA